MSKKIEIILKPDEKTDGDLFWDRFIDFAWKNSWYFGGGSVKKVIPVEYKNLN